MAEMQFDLVSPERSLASFAAQSVQIPGTDGDMTVMADHAPTITTLRPGVMRVEAGGDVKEFVSQAGLLRLVRQVFPFWRKRHLHVRIWRKRIWTR